MKVVIALGANLGNPRVQINTAIEALRAYIQISAISTFIETTPFDVPDVQPNYLNAVLMGTTDVPALTMMRKLLEIEENLGRIRISHNGARTIDLDLIDYNGEISESEELVLPHPRAHIRRFVLEPWLEIDRDAYLPGRGAVRELLASLG